MRFSAWLMLAIGVLVPPNPALATEVQAAEQKAEAQPDKPKKAKKKAKAPPRDEPNRPRPRFDGRAGPAMDATIRKVTTAIRESMELGPTLVVWLIDRTPSAQGIVSEATTAAKGYYDSTEVHDWATDKDQQLLTAIATFDDKLEFILDPPAADPQQVVAGFSAIRSTSASRELTFAAIKQTVDKFLPLRIEKHHEVLVVVVTDEAGDDPVAAEGLAETLRRAAIPLYVIGLPAPWGESNPFAQNPKAANSAVSDDSLPTVGPESLFSERVDILGWSPGANLDLVDSGFGPFALERLCRACRGKFFAVRPDSGNSSSSGRQWPTGRELRFNDGVQNKYAPDYVSETEYRKLLSANKACAALHEAAKLPKVVLEGSIVTRFPKAEEAKMAKKSSEAQQFAARNQQAVEQLYSALQVGEADREKLSSPRWQAEFDLALGRAMATKVRLEGYNSMIAALKRGKTFANPDSKAWILTPADAFETESTLRRLGERAKTYLERVVKEHPGTPWAKIAEEELKSPLGWTWKES